MVSRAVFLVLLVPLISSAASVNLTWTAPNNVPGTVTNSRTIDRKAPWQTHSTVPVGTLTASDTTAGAGETCSRVRATNATVVSDPRNVACVTLPHAPVNVTVPITLSGSLE